ncbi:hypothetical protein N9M73_00865 [Rhodobacteraceae bacterium]|nr:hypothetical protein [Paracoccaceae bacterium]
MVEANLLFSGAGNNTLTGGRGDDIMTGGTHRDVHVFNGNDGSDVITDFVSGKDLIKFKIAGLNSGNLNITNTTSGAQIAYDNGGTNAPTNIEANHLTQEVKILRAFLKKMRVHYPYTIKGARFCPPAV